MVNNLNFDATVSKWAQASQARMEAIFRESVQRLVEEMLRPVGDGGNMPIITGFLRASFRMGLGGAQFAIIKAPKGAKASFAVGDYSMTIAKLKIGDVVTGVFVANYAQRIEEGFVGQDASGRSYNQSGRHFVKLACQRWPTIVRQVSAEAKRRTP